MFMTLKISKTKSIAVIVLVIVVLMVAMSCTESNPFSLPKNPNPVTGNLVIGEIGFILNQGENLDDLLLSYSDFEFRFIANDLNENWYEFAFNYNQKDGTELDEMLLRDPRVDNIEDSHLLPGWIRGELLAGFYRHSPDELNEFLRLFSDYDFRIISHAETTNHFRFSFNPDLIDEYEILDMVRKHPLVWRAEFNGPWRFWMSGVLLVQIEKHFIDEVTSFYIKHGVDIRFMIENDPMPRPFMLAFFEYDQIDEFKLVDILNNDQRVYWAEFAFIFQTFNKSGEQ